MTGISTPLASFTDSVGTHFQYTPDQAAFPNVLQFGCKGDWNGSDGGATDNFSCFQAASWFATYKSSTSFDAGGWWGGKVLVPSGSFMLCGTGSQSLIVANNVTFEGAAAAGGSTLKMCDSFSAGAHFVEICDPVIVGNSIRLGCVLN